MSRNILLVGNYPPPYGGIATHIETVASRLRQEVDFSVVVLDIEPQKIKKKNGTLQAGSRLGLITKLVQEFLKADCVHLHTNGHNSKSLILLSITGLIARSTKTPAIATLHSGACPAYIKSISRARAFFIRECLMGYSKIIGVNKDIVQSLVLFGYENRKICHIPAYAGLLGSPDARLNENIEDFFSSHSPVFSTVVSFSPEYGLECLTKAFVSFQKSVENRAGLIVVGSGGNRTVVDRLVKHFHLEAHILILEDLKPSTLYAVVRRSHVFIRATLFDGDAISVREALSLSTPVIASDTGFRPPGVVTFPINDDKELLLKLQEISQASTALDWHQRNSITVLTDSFEQLRDLYKVVTYRLPKTRSKNEIERE